MFDKVAIIGVGLIGGSLGLAIKKKRLAREVIGVTRHRGSLKKARSLGVVDRGTLDPLEAAKDADLIMIATPISEIPRVVKKLIGSLKPGCIITDVGSAKSKVVGQVEKILPKGIYFVGGHPMAGSEKRGVGQAKVDLFESSVCFLTRTRRTSPEALKVVKNFWRKVGAKVEVVSPDLHDRIVATISHLPHLVAFNLASVAPLSNLRYAAGGFRDTTRIASSDPVIWRDIYLANSKEVAKALDRFIRSLKKTRALILTREGQKLLKVLKGTKAKRDGYLKR